VFDVANTAHVSYARQLARSLGLDDNVFVALITSESGWDPNAVGDGGKARGYGQLWEVAVDHMGGDYERAKSDPLYNLEMSAKYLKYMFSRFKNYYDAIRGYKAGEGRAKKNPTAAAGKARTVMEMAGRGGDVPETATTENNEDKPTEEKEETRMSSLLWTVSGVIVLIVLFAFGLYMLAQGQNVRDAASLARVV